MMATFHVGDRVRAARDITDEMMTLFIRDGEVRIRQGQVGTVVAFDGGEPLVSVVDQTNQLREWFLHPDWLEPADAPADADVVAAIVAALTAELANVTPAYERAVGDVVWRQYYGGKSDGIALALRIVREIGKVQP